MGNALYSQTVNALISDIYFIYQSTMLSAKNAHISGNILFANLQKFLYTTFLTFYHNPVSNSL